MSWQPIETAPIGEDVLVFSPDAREPGVIVAALLEFVDEHGVTGGAEWHDVWLETNLDVEPTYWMPMPAPPDDQAMRARSSRLGAEHVGADKS